MRTYYYFLMRLLFALFFLNLNATKLFAAEQILKIDDSLGTKVSVSTFIDVLEDYDASLSFADLQRPDVYQRFKRADKASEALNFGQSRSAYWLRLIIQNTNVHSDERILDISHPTLSYVQMYMQNENRSVQKITTGNALPFASRAYPHRFFVFPVVVPAFSKQIFYFRIQSANPVIIPMKLWEPKTFYSYERTDYFYQALYYGGALAMIFYNLLLFVVLRDRIYLKYISFVLFMALSVGTLNGLTKEFLWPDNSLWAEAAFHVLMCMAIASLLLFMRSLLEVKASFPRIDRLLQLLTGLLFVTAPAFIISISTFAQFGPPIYAYSLILVLSIGVLSYWKRQRSSRFFLMAFALFLMGGVMTALRAMGVLPNNTFTIYGMQFGSAIEMVLLAFALSDRFNQIRSESAETQKQFLEVQQQALDTEKTLNERLRLSEEILELRVKERTSELSKSMAYSNQLRDSLMQQEKLAALGSLVAGVAHELNTPIGNTLLIASTLESTSFEIQTAFNDGGISKARLNTFLQTNIEMTRIMTKSCDTAATLIGSFKQIAVDRSSEKRRMFDLTDVIWDNIAAIKTGTKRENWTFEVNIPNKIQCDSYPGPLSQVITNLVQNAIKHGFDGLDSGIVNVTAMLDAETVELKISDNGNGIDAHALARIFEPFYTTKLGQGGSGLGLSVSLNIVTSVLGGTMNVTSNREIGTCFTLRFPQIVNNMAEVEE